MTSEEKLDEVLKFLATHDHMGGSFDYYDKVKAEWNKMDNYLFKHLESVGVKGNELYPIVYHLYKDNYIDAYWEPPEEKQKGNSPNQIKITFDGIMFIDNGGYTQQKINRLQTITDTNDRNQRMERNEALLATWTQNLANRTKELTNWTRVVGIGAVGLVVWEIVAFFLEHC